MIWKCTCAWKTNNRQKPKHSMLCTKAIPLAWAAISPAPAMCIVVSGNNMQLTGIGNFCGYLSYFAGKPQHQPRWRLSGICQSKTREKTDATAQIWHCQRSKPGFAKVYFEGDDKIVTDWWPVLQRTSLKDKESWPLNVNEHVVCLC